MILSKTYQLIAFLIFFSACHLDAAPLINDFDAGPKNTTISGVGGGAGTGGVSGSEPDAGMKPMAGMGGIGVTPTSGVGGSLPKNPAGGAGGLEQGGITAPMPIAGLGGMGGVAGNPNIAGTGGVTNPPLPISGTGGNSNSDPKPVIPLELDLLDLNPNFYPVYGEQISATAVLRNTTRSNAQVKHAVIALRRNDDPLDAPSSYVFRDMSPQPRNFVIGAQSSQSFTASVIIPAENTFAWRVLIAWQDINDVYHYGAIQQTFVYQASPNYGDVEYSRFNKYQTPPNPAAYYADVNLNQFPAITMNIVVNNSGITRIYATGFRVNVVSPSGIVSTFNSNMSKTAMFQYIPGMMMLFDFPTTSLGIYSFNTDWRDDKNTWHTLDNRNFEIVQNPDIPIEPADASISNSN